MNRIWNVIIVSIIVLAGCQTDQTIRAYGPYTEIEKTLTLDLTFVNDWEGAIGPPKLGAFGRRFLDTFSTISSDRNVSVKTMYTGYGGFITGRYYMQIGPRANYGYCRMGVLCIWVKLYDMKYEKGFKPIWGAMIDLDPRDENERQSENKGYGTSSADYLATALVLQLEKIGFYQ